MTWTAGRRGRCSGEARSIPSRIDPLPDRGMQVREYLEATEIMDWDRPEVLTLARALAEGRDDPVAVAGLFLVRVRRVPVSQA